MLSAVDLHELESVAQRFMDMDVHLTDCTASAEDFHAAKTAMIDIVNLCKELLTKMGVLKPVVTRQESLFSDDRFDG